MSYCSKDSVITLTGQLSEEDIEKIIAQANETIQNQQLKGASKMTTKEPDKEYIVSIRVGFTTPLDAVSSTDKTAAVKCILEFTDKFNKFQETLNDITDLKIEVDYIECQE